MKDYKTKEEFENASASKTIKVVGEYKSYFDMTLFKCDVCSHEWEERPIKLINKKVCPECFKRCTNSPYGLNVPDRYYVKARSIKMAFIKYKGGICNDCGVNLINDHWKADFHHINPDEKEIEINKLNGVSLTTLKELQKTVLLCSYCHRKIHAEHSRFEQHKDIIEKNSELFLEKLKSLESKLES